MLGKGWECENADGHCEELGWGMEQVPWAGCGDKEMVQSPKNSQGCLKTSFASVAARDV